VRLKSYRDIHVRICEYPKPEDVKTNYFVFGVSKISTKYKNLEAFHSTVERDVQENKKRPMKNLDNSI